MCLLRGTPSARASVTPLLSKVKSSDPFLMSGACPTGPRQVASSPLHHSTHSCWALCFRKSQGHRLRVCGSLNTCRHLRGKQARQHTDHHTQLWDYHTQPAWW